MAALVRRWRASTETQASFAARHGVAVGTLRYWIRRVPADRAPVPEGGAVEVALASGDRVIVREGATVELVQTVLAALRRAC